MKQIPDGIYSEFDRIVNNLVGILYIPKGM